MQENNLFAYEKPEPDFRIPFRVVPSWNDVLSSIQSSNAKFNPVSNEVTKWRKRGRERAVEVFAENGMTIVPIRRELRSIDKRTGLHKAEIFKGLERPLFDEPVACIVRLWRPSAAAFDVHNLVVKPIIDGFGDVNIFETDAVRGFPELGFVFEGIDPELKLTKAEADERKAYFQKYKDRDKNPPRLPLPARIWFDFYKLARLRFGTIYEFQTIS